MDKEIEKKLNERRNSVNSLQIWMSDSKVLNLNHSRCPDD